MSLLWDIMMAKGRETAARLAREPSPALRRVEGAFGRQVVEPVEEVESEPADEVSTLCMKCRERPKAISEKGNRLMHCEICVELCTACGVRPKAITKKGQRIAYCRVCSSEKTKANTERRREGRSDRKGRPPRSLICPACGVAERSSKRLCPRCLKESQRRWRSDWKLRQEELKAKE